MILVTGLGLGAGSARASWSAPVAFSAPGDSLSGATVAANDDGGAAIAWSNQVDSYTASIEVAVRQGSGAFSSPQTISLPQTGANVDPSVAVGADGTVAVLWSEENSIAVISFGSVSGGAFSPPLALEPASQSYAPLYPHVSIDAAGDVFAAWVNTFPVTQDGDTGANNDIEYTTRPHGATAFGPVQQVTSPTGYIDDPTFASAPSGATIVSWSGGYAAVRPAGGRFGPAQSQAGGCFASGPDPVAIDSAGDAIVTWNATDCVSSTPTAPMASYMPAAGDFGAAQPIVPASSHAAVASVAMSPTGEPTAAVEADVASPGIPEGLTTLTRSAQGSWGSPGVIYDTAGSPDAPLGDDLQHGVSLAYDAGGDLYAVWDVRQWVGDETADSGIFAEMQPAGGAFDGAPVQIEETDDALDSAANLATTGQDGALAVWSTGGSGHESGSPSSGAVSGGGAAGGGGASSGGSGATGAGASGADPGAGPGAAAGGSSTGDPGPPSPQDGAAAGPGSTPTGTPTPAPTATPAERSRTIVIRGRARDATSVSIDLFVGRRRLAHRRLTPERGRFAVRFVMRGVTPRRLRAEITLVSAGRRTTTSRVIGA